jgi:hypothetical protein
VIALPLVAEAAVAAVLVLSVARAFFGPAPARADAVAAGAWMAAALLLLATVLLSDGDSAWRLAMTVGGAEAACVAGWWLRSRPPRDEPGGEGPGPGPDWGEFDRLRDCWNRPRVGL